MTPYYDRRDAGRQLADELPKNPILRANPNDLVVLGIPRGGVVVADEIAKALHAPLDVFITRKIGAPFNPELAVGAVASGGVTILDEQLIRELRISHSVVYRERDRQLREIERRMSLFRGQKPPPEVKDKVVIVADDGIATGATTHATLQALRQLGPSRLVLAVPVAPPQVMPMLRAEADEVVVLDTPDPFIAVGNFYEDFTQVGDDEVVEILQCA